MTESPSAIKTAFILGAGLGTRLRPLTDACPKPLLPVQGRPLITYAMDHLLAVGVERFIVNTHHCAAAYEKAFPENSWQGSPIQFRFEPILLNTGGGLKNIEDLLENDPALWIYNGDILTDIPLTHLLARHRAGGREVTLALRTTGSPRNVSIDALGRICDFRFILGRDAAQYGLFTGIYLVEKRFLQRLQPGGREDIVTVFLDMVREEPGAVGHVFIDEGMWHDIGSPAAYEAVNSGKGF